MKIHLSLFAFFSSPGRMALSLFACMMFLTSCGSSSSLKETPEAYLLTANVHNRCMEILREGLHSDQTWPIVYAAEALFDAGYAFDVMPVLHERLKNGTDLQDRAGIAGALVRAGERQALVELQDILLTSDTEAQVQAADAMFRAGDVADVSLLWAAMDSVNDGRLRIYAAGAIARARGEDTIEMIREGLNSPNSDTRSAAADVIATIGSRKDDLAALLPHLERTSSDPERFYTIRALAFFDYEPAREELIRLLRHRDPAIRSRAAYAAAETWLVQESDQIYAMLDDPDLSVRVRAAQALLILSNPASLYRFSKGM